jgi:hypothetical protein
MIRQTARVRSGITLTEILISILILGVGVTSLAVLFPIGLERLRRAQRLSRGAYLAESAAADLGARNLLAKGSFYQSPFYAPWYQTAAGAFYDPWIVDTPAYGVDPRALPPAGPGAARVVGPGLPVAYDPLWRAVIGIYPDPFGKNTPEARFGAGYDSSTGNSFIRPDPTDKGAPGANGLQRLSNFRAAPPGTVPQPALGAPLLFNPISATQVLQNYSNAIQTFVSPEDVLFQDPKGVYTDTYGTGNQIINPNPTAPDLNTGGGATVSDWRYSYLFTGQQVDTSNGTVFDGDIVICENRQFAIEKVPTPFGGQAFRVEGETVVEAVWGYTSTPAKPLTTIGFGSTAASRSVVLRWPTAQADPDVRVGGWIADVTYERNQSIVASRYPTPPYPYAVQRCYWYQVTKKSDATDDPGFAGDSLPYRRMTVWVSTPLRAQSLLDFTAKPAAPVHTEAALIMPSVVNVYPRTVYTR